MNKFNKDYFNDITSPSNTDRHATMNLQNLKTRLKIGTLSIVTAFLCWQCESDAVIAQDTQTETYIETIDASLALNEILDRSITTKNDISILNEIDFDKKVSKINHESGKRSYTFAILNNDISFKTDNFVYTAENIGVELYTDGSYTLYILRYIPDMFWFNDPYKAIDNYSGEIQVLDIDRQTLNILTLINGELIESSIPSGKGISCSIIVNYEYYGCTDNSSATEFCQDIVININTNCGGGDLPDGGNPSNPNDGDDNGNGGGGSAGGGDISIVPILGTCIETNTCVEQVDTSQLEGKEKCAYEALLASNGNLFNETIGTFGVPGSRYNLTFIYADCYGTVEACTNASDIDNGNLIIKIADRGLDVLEYAALILHEGVHAEIYRYVHENGGNIDPNERINLYNKYKEFKVQAGSLTNTSIAQHQHMADRYVYPIARAIKELDGHRFPLEHYLGFGWDGLRKYGFDGYYNDDLEYIQFESIDYYSELEGILETTTIGNNCDE